MTLRWLIALAALLAGDAMAQGTFTVKLLTPETALKAARAALERCRGSGYQVAVAVTDRAGVVQVLVRDPVLPVRTPSIWRAPRPTPPHLSA